MTTPFQHFATPLLPTTTNIDWAAMHLLAGNVVAIPTETVYGLAALSHLPSAVDLIFKTKNRPTNHPLIVHIANTQAIDSFALNDIACIKGKRLAQVFWPGPLTLILNKQQHIPTNVTGGQNTIALRCPNHAVTLQLLAVLQQQCPHCDIGLAAPSANRFGKVSPTVAEHVTSEFSGTIPVLEGGACQGGIESTIIDLTHSSPTILRPGLISAQDIEWILNEPVFYRNETLETDIRYPGQLLSHYAPNTPTQLIENISQIPAALTHLPNCIIYSLIPCPETIQSELLSTQQWITAPQTAAAYAQTLYLRLRQFDVMDCQQILLHLPPTLNEEWRGILDRVRKAASIFSHGDHMIT